MKDADGIDARTRELIDGIVASAVDHGNGGSGLHDRLDAILCTLIRMQLCTLTSTPIPDALNHQATRVVDHGCSRGWRVELAGTRSGIERGPASPRSACALSLAECLVWSSTGERRT